MKRLFLIIVIMVLGMPIKAEALKGGVMYTVESARKEAFEDVQYKISMKPYAKYMTDPNYESNKEAMAKGISELPDRWVEHFSDETYSVVYKKYRLKVFSYSINGNLEAIEIRSGSECPIKAFGYNIYGELIEVLFYNSKTDIYIYKIDGVLDTHWIGNNGYDKNGKLIIKRIK